MAKRKVPTVIFLSVIGLALGAYYAYKYQLQLQNNEPYMPPASPPPNTIAAAKGLIEPRDGSIGIYPVRADRVEELRVQENQEVKAGDVLYTMRTRGLLDERRILEAQYMAAMANCQYLREQPRASDVAPLEAAVAVRKVEQERLAKRLERLRKLYPLAVSQDELDNEQKLYEAAVASLKLAETELAQLKAGVSPHQISQAEAQAAQIQAQLQQLDTQIAESVLRSPIDGVVMKINIHQGEYISLFNPVRDDATSTPVVIGAKALQVRVDVDETDAFMLDGPHDASAVLKGDSGCKLRLRFNRIQPMAVPKRNLAGFGAERIDVRVVQIIYDVEPPPFPVWPGQQVDVFIERKPSQETSEDPQA